MGAPILEADHPLSAEEWERLNSTVVRVAQRSLVARRFVDLYGPLGAGVQTVPYDEYTGVSPGALDLVGEQETQPVFTDIRRFRTVPLLYKDFLLHWRDIEAARTHKLPLDVSAAAGAASFCAQKEDELVFYGDTKLGFEGIFNTPGRLISPLSDWATPGNGFANVIDATERLQRSGHLGPYAMVLAPRLFASLHRVYEKTGVLEIETLRQLIVGGIFQSSLLRGDVAAVVSTGPENLDIAVALDMSVAYLGPQRMNHPFRVLEAALPRIKHPDSICTIERAPAA
ncbi:MAG: bacteriocin family protein [Deltaproteobacteria bacterium]|nr:bacteriocin family protein [Deltaproteobacteria bacterium]